jgi:hypothetical protein
MARILSMIVLPMALIATGGCVQQIKASRVKSALIDGGLSEQLSECMANRMASKLSIGQLRKLQALSGPKRGISDYIDAVRRVGDADALEVTASSAALCKTGLIR